MNTTAIVEREEPKSFPAMLKLYRLWIAQSWANWQ